MRREQLSVNELTVRKIIGCASITPGVGEVYHVSVVKAVREWLEQRSEDEHVFSTIALAAAKCSSYRNDYIIVHDGPYGLTTTIDLSSLNSVHLIGAGGFGMEIGSPGGAYIVQTGAYPTITLGHWCEIAGLQIWNCSGEEAIYGSLKQGNNIHHNFFRMVASAGITSGIELAGGYGNNYNRIERNKLIHYAGTAAGAAIKGGSGTGNDVCNNEIIVYGGVVYDYGINFASEAGAQINDNKISDCGGSGTITIGIQAKTTNGTVLIGNKLQLPTTTGLAGGTANRSFVGNFDAQAGGAAAIES